MRVKLSSELRLRAVEEHLQISVRLPDRAKRTADDDTRSMISTHCVNSNTNSHGAEIREISPQDAYALYIRLSLNNLTPPVHPTRRADPMSKLAGAALRAFLNRRLTHAGIIDAAPLAGAGL